MDALFAIVGLLSLPVFLVSVIAMIFKKWRRKAMGAAVASVVGFVFAIIGSNEQTEAARQQGYKSTTELRHAQQEKAREAVAEKEAQRRELLNQPDPEARFVAMIDRNREQYKKGESDLQRGAVRPARSNEICSFSSDLNRWVGTIAALSTNGDGKGVVSVKIANRLHLSTTNNSLSDIGSNTLITSDSSLYRALLTMKVGDTVRVDGEFLRGGPDCFREHSLTLAGSIQDPDFWVRFSRIDKVELP